MKLLPHDGKKKCLHKVRYRFDVSEVFQTLTKKKNCNASLFSALQPFKHFIDDFCIIAMQKNEFVDKNKSCAGKNSRKIIDVLRNVQKNFLSSILLFARNFNSEQHSVVHAYNKNMRIVFHSAGMFKFVQRMKISCFVSIIFHQC